MLKKLLRRLLPVPARRSIVRAINLAGAWLPFRLQGKVTYCEDGLLTVHNCDFASDPRFAAAYAAGRATDSWDRDIRWRTHVLCWAGAHASKLEGDFVECGVNRGGYSLAVMEYLGFEKLGRRFFLMDTFRGLVEEQITEAERANGIDADRYVECHEAVQTTFAGYPNVRIVRGAIPATLGEVDAETVAYLHIDMNVVAPEISAAEHFWDRMPRGGVLVIDDYGFRKHHQQKLAFDRFARERDVEVLSLPTGQGLILKP